MATDSNDFLSLPPTVWIALAVSIAGAFALHQHPFQDNRPLDPAIPMYRHLPTDDQDVEARLWQDPLAAVATARLTTTKAQENATAPPHAINELQAEVKASLAMPQPVMILAAFVSGAPFPEDVETRRRTRYAVLAGLYRQGFVPTNNQHLGYVKLAQFYPPSAKARDIAAYEWFDSERAAEGVKTRVLLLWLDQDGFRSTPLSRLSRIVNTIVSNDACAVASESLVTTTILGPADSDGLRAVGDEVRAPKDEFCTPKSPIRRLSIYSSRATAGGGDVPETGSYLAGKIDLYRTVANDQLLAERLKTELSYRSIQNPSQIALVAERDTLYARKMGGYFGGCKTVVDVESKEPLRTSQPTCFTYLRGLDGLSPPQPVNVDAANSTPADPATSSSTPASVASEAPTGQGQLDYLRRLSQSLGNDKQHFKAIGVVGDDVYDKLLVLQALRTALPRAIFFTTDLDARLLDQKNLPWTRQLLVASSLGLSLRPCLQQGTPPFRDTYQSTAYFSTVLATHRFLTSAGTAKSADPCLFPNAEQRTPQASDSAYSAGLSWTESPRLIEIGHNSPYDLTKDADAARSCDFDADCASIAAPHGVGLLGDASATACARFAWVVTLIAALMTWAAGGTCWALDLVLARGCKYTAQWRRLLSMALLLGVWILSDGLWPALVNVFTDHGRRVPSAILGGGSLWATCLAEVLSVLAVITLVIRGQRKLDENADQMQVQFGFIRREEAVTRRAIQVGNNGRRTIERLWLPHCLRVGVHPPLPGKAPVSAVETLSAHYLFRGTAYARLLRVGLATFVTAIALMQFEIFLDRSLIGVAALNGPNSLAVGKADWIANLISLVSLLFMLFLILWVTDALLLSRSFMQDLLARRPAWPPLTIQKKSQALGLRLDQTTLWLDLELIGMRTSWVTDLIWYPSLVLLFMILAALTTEFGQFGFADNPSAIILSVALVILASILLRGSAESWRGDVVQKLEEERLHGLSPYNAVNTKQLSRLIKHVRNLSAGAFAPLSAQPVVHAVLIPAITYGASALLGFMHIAQ